VVRDADDRHDDVRMSRCALTTAMGVDAGVVYVDTQGGAPG